MSLCLVCVWWGLRVWQGGEVPYDSYEISESRELLASTSCEFSWSGEFVYEVHEYYEFSESGDFV